jgi:hypothetical protein
MRAPRRMMRGHCSADESTQIAEEPRYAIGEQALAPRGAPRSSASGPVLALNGATWSADS